MSPLDYISSSSYATDVCVLARACVCVCISERESGAPNCSLLAKQVTGHVEKEVNLFARFRK